MIINTDSPLLTFAKKIGDKWYTQGASLFFNEEIALEDGAIIVPFNYSQLNGVYQVFKANIINDSNI